MHLSVTRLDDRRYETLITRRDGVCFHVKGVGHLFAIPHDMAHLAIEEALRLPHGFWGSVADGAVFGTMTHFSGRRKPRASDRSKAVLKTNEGRISEAEVLVSIFNTALEQGHGAESMVLRERLRERWTPPGEAVRQFTDAEIAAACSVWRRMLSLWRALPVGGTLRFAWPAEPLAVRGTAGRPNPRTVRRRRRREQPAIRRGADPSPAARR